MEKHISCTVYILIVLMNLMFLAKTGILEDKKTWTYELESVTTKSSDEEKLKINLTMERVSRGVYALSGNIIFNYDIVEGDSNHIAVKSYRSAYGNDDYTILPFQYPETHIFDYLNNLYKITIMDSMSKCSNFPVFEDKFQPPPGKKMYTLDYCKFSRDGFPSHLQEGLYKVSIIGTGEVDWQIDVTAEVTPDI